MKEPPNELPVACCLTSAEFREREANLLAQFRSAVTGIEELADGYVFCLSGDRKTILLVADVIAAERECCRFLTFELKAYPNTGPAFVRMTGPPGTKEFLKAVLLMPQASI